MFSENLRKRRLELGISQAELAETVGYRSRSSITKLESGISDIPQKKLRLLAEALNTTPEDLIGEDKPSLTEVVHQHVVKPVGSGRVVALIQAGGKSTRNSLSIPSQFVNVDDKPVIAYVLEAYQKHPQIDEIDVICLYGWEKTLRSYADQYHITKLNKIVTGGNTILDSVKVGFSFIQRELNDDDVVILQEATRPMINEGLISKILSSYNTYGNSVYVKPMSEYVQIEKKGEDYELCRRGNLFCMESPEIYSASFLREALVRQRKETPDDGSCTAVLLHRMGMPLHYCESTANNMKIVTQEDIYIFKVLQQVIL